MEKSNRLRLFVAVPLPEEVKSAIAEAQLDLRETLSESSITWTRPEQFHLTLKFLGSVRAEDVEPLRKTLDAATAGFDPLELTASGAGFFPSASRPRVIWVGLEDATDQLRDLQMSVEQAVQPFSAEEPENRFHAHVTLGRVKFIPRQEVEIMRQWSERQAEEVYGSWIGNQVFLVQSQLSPKGAVYTVLEAAGLKGG
jgi:RNA 2',3'-cyclic 3'-phosphodiesterase